MRNRFQSRRKQLSNREMRNLAKNMIDRKVEREIKRLGLDRIDRKFGNHPGLTESEIKNLDKKEKVVRFIKAMFHKDMATVKALSEGVGSEGGFTVPEEFAAEVNRIVEDFGLIRKMARKIPMLTDKMNVPRLGSSVIITFPGENTEGTPSDPVFQNVQLVTSTAIGLTVLSNELLADANISHVDFLTELFAEALAGEEDKQGLVGVGTPFTGILSDAAVNLVTMTAGNVAFTDVIAEDLRDMISQLKAFSLAGAGFVMHRTVWGIVQKLKDADGQFFVTHANPVFAPVASQDQGAVPAVTVGALWGYPVWLSEQMPNITDSAVSTKFIMFGNLRHLWMGTRQDIEMSISDSATVAGTNAFAANQSAVRVIERFALEVGLPEAFAVLRTAAV